MLYYQTGDISTLDGTPLKLVDKFTYLGSSVESTEKDIETRLTKAWTAINRQSIIWKSDLTDKMKRSFFQAAVTSILLYGCTTWTLIKWLEKKLDGNYTRMLRAILNKSWRQHPTRHQLYGHLPPITKTIQVRRTRHAGDCWRSRDELIRDVLLWTPTHGCAKAGRPARTYIQQLSEDTRCCPEDLPRAMNDREEWRERVRHIRATSATWWWWWYIYIWFDTNGLTPMAPIWRFADSITISKPSNWCHYSPLLPQLAIYLFQRMTLFKFFCTFYIPLLLSFFLISFSSGSIWFKSSPRFYFCALLIVSIDRLLDIVVLKASEKLYIHRKKYIHAYIYIYIYIYIL